MSEWPVEFRVPQDVMGVFNLYLHLHHILSKLLKFCVHVVHMCLILYICISYKIHWENVVLVHYA